MKPLWTLTDRIGRVVTVELDLDTTAPQFRQFIGRLGNRAVENKNGTASSSGITARVVKVDDPRQLNLQFGEKK